MNETTLLLLIAAGVNGAGMGAGASGMFWWLSRRHDAEVHRLQAEHTADVAAREQEHQRKQAQREQDHQHEQSAMRAEVVSLKAQIRLLVGMLQGRNIISADEAGAINNGSVDPVYMALKSWFSLNELEAVARDAGINIENIGGDTIEIVAGRMMEYARRHDLYERLTRVVKAARPGQVAG